MPQIKEYTLAGPRWIIKTEDYVPGIQFYPEI
jgi:hypothetical protein